MQTTEPPKAALAFRPSRIDCRAITGAQPPWLVEASLDGRGVHWDASPAHGALDAPERLPTGSYRAIDDIDGGECIGFGTCERERA